LETPNKGKLVGWGLILKLAFFYKYRRRSVLGEWRITCYVYA